MFEKQMSNLEMGKGEPTGLKDLKGLKSLQTFFATFQTFQTLSNFSNLSAHPFPAPGSTFVIQTFSNLLEPAQIWKALKELEL